MTPVIDGLAVRGRLIVIDVDAEPIEISPLQLIGASRSVVGHTVGASIDDARRRAFPDGVDQRMRRRMLCADRGPVDENHMAGQRQLIGRDL
jgi:alcohol dehydrogenase